MNTKDIKFSFRDKDGVVLKTFDIHIDEKTTWLNLEQMLSNNIKKFTGKDPHIENLVYDWCMKKEFSNGTHFFIDYDNEFGFASAYLYKDN